MYGRAIFSLAFVLTICVARDALAAEPHRTEVNVGWVRLSQTDRGWQIERVRELGDWNLLLLEGDLLTQIEGQDASNLGPISMAAFIEDAMMQKIQVTIERKGQPQHLEVFAGEEDHDADTRRFYAQYGVGLMLTSRAPGTGATVARVTPGSPAEESDLRQDDRILAVDGKDVSTFEVSEVAKLLRSDRPSSVKLRVLRQDTRFEVTVNRTPTRDLFPKEEAVSNALPVHKRGGPAPAFELLSTRGERVRLEDFRGKWVLLNFWGVWCSLCHFELPFLEAWSKRYAGKLVILGLDVNDKPDSLQRYLAGHPLAYQVLLAGQLDDALAKSYAVRGLPLSVLVDPKGVVRYVEVGFEPSSPSEPPPLESFLQSIQP